jgi:transposase
LPKDAAPKPSLGSRIMVDDHNCDASRIKQVCIDMSAAYIKGVTGNLTEAEITFDKFHAVKLVNDAVDKVRRAEGQRTARAQEKSLSLAAQ